MAAKITIAGDHCQSPVNFLAEKPSRLHQYQKIPFLYKRKSTQASLKSFIGKAVLHCKNSVMRVKLRGRGAGMAEW